MKKLSLFVMALLGVAFTSTVAMAQEDLCTPFFECLDACGEDQACYQQCAQEADPNVVNSYIAVSECADGAGCFDLAEDEIEQCISENCSVEYDDFNNACFGGGGPANNGGIPSGPCDGAFECLNSCEDAQCAQGCAGEAETADGEAAISDYVNCIINNQCADETCVEENCAAEAGQIEAACFGGAGNNSSGNNSTDPFNNAGNNSEPFNNSGNNNSDDNNGVILPGNNGGSGNNSNPVEDGEGGSDDNNGSSGNNGGSSDNGSDDEDGDGGGSTTTVTCSVSSLGGGATSGGAFLLLGLVVLGLRRRR